MPNTALLLFFVSARTNKRHHHHTCTTQPPGSAPVLHAAAPGRRRLCAQTALAAPNMNTRASSIDSFGTIDEEEQSLFKANARTEVDAGRDRAKPGSFILRHYRGTQGACGEETGASLEPDESEGCSLVPLSPVVGESDFARLFRLTTLQPRFEHLWTVLPSSFRVCKSL